MPDPAVELVRAALAGRGSARIRVRGTSMEPTVAGGTTVRVTRARFADVVPGTVVAFRGGPGMVVHRVVERTGRLLLTRGDNMQLFDPPVDEASFLGVVPDCAAAPGPSPLAASLPRSGPAPGAGRSQGRHLWLFGPAGIDAAVRVAFPALRGWTLHVRPRVGVGVDAGTLARLRATTSGTLCVGVSEYGARPVEALREVPSGTDLTVLVGCHFGALPTGPADGVLLPPGLAAVHVRVGAPLVPVDPVTAAVAVLREFTVEPPAVPAGRHRAG